MLALPQLDTGAGARWKTRYNAPKLAAAKLASREKTRGVAVSDHEGVTQLFAWDVGSGALARRTDEPRGGVGVLRGSIDQPLESMP